MNEELTTIEIPTEQAELLTSISKSISEGDRSTLESNIKVVRGATNTVKMIRQMEEGTYQEALYMKEGEIDTAYKHVLNSEESPSVEECYDKIMDDHGVTYEYIQESKSRPNKHIKSVIQDNKEHLTVKKMKKNNVFDIEGLNKSTTPNQLLINITTRRSVSDRLDKLESKVEELSLRTSMAEARQDSTDVVLSDMINFKDHKQIIAKSLRARDVKIKDIAQLLEVDQRTVKRWLSNLKDVILS